MLEACHHITWLNEANAKLDLSTAADVREYVLAVCQQVLEQNPKSDYAKQTRTRVENLCVGHEKKLPDRTLDRCDTVNLLTGEKVVNIPWREINPRLFEYIVNGSYAALDKAQSGVATVDLRPYVEACDGEGPLPGFQEVFTAQERSRLDRADPELCRKCITEIKRLFRGSQVEKEIPSMQNALEHHVKPLISRIQNTDTRQSVECCMELWQRNLQNPYCNLYYRTASAPIGMPYPDDEYAIPLMCLDRSYFSIGLLGSEEIDSAGAASSPSERSIHVWPSDTNGYDFLRAIQLVHELTHILRHKKLLEKLGSDTPESLAINHKLSHARTQKAVAEGKTVLDIDEECETWANETELLFEASGRDITMDPYTVAQTLEIPLTAFNIGILEFRQQLTQVYYQGGGRKGTSFPPAFVNLLERTLVKIMRAANLDVVTYVTGPDGIPVPKNETQTGRTTVIPQTKKKVNRNASRNKKKRNRRRKRK